MMIVKTPCDPIALAHSPELPKSIYDPGEELFGLKERDALVDEALTLGAQPGFIPQPIAFEYGLSQTRYNKIEGLSTGISASQSLGAIVYEMITGERLFQGETDFSTLAPPTYVAFRLNLHY